MVIYTFITDIHTCSYVDQVAYILNFKLSLMMAFLKGVVRGIVNYEIEITIQSSL